MLQPKPHKFCTHCGAKLESFDIILNYDHQTGKPNTFTTVDCPRCQAHRMTNRERRSRKEY